MLARLMVFLGTDVNRAQSLVAQAEKDTTKPEIAKATDNQAALTLGEPFDRAWRRVGVAIDSAGFSVDDRDRSSGDYFVRYLDTDTGEKIEQGNFLTRMFGGKNTAEATQFRIHVAQQGAGSLVQVLDQKGQPNNSATAQRIISVLSNHL
jgi:outer membrane protein assembly factor BamC